MKLRCQSLVLPERRCPFETHGDGRFCYWHTVAGRFGAKPPAHGDTAMTRCGLFGIATVIALVSFVRTTDTLWLLAAFWTGTAAVIQFCTGMIVRDYPLSHLLLWPRAAGLGTLVAGVAAYFFASLLLLTPELFRGMVWLGGTQPGVPGWAPAFLGGVAVFAGAMHVHAFLRKVAFRGSPLYDLILMGLSTVIYIGLLNFSVYRATAAPREAAAFDSILGPFRFWHLALAAFVAFNACEIVNVRMRRMTTPEIFRDTFAISYFICTAPLLIAIPVARIGLPMLDISSGWVLIAASTLLSVAICVLLTRRSIRTAAVRPVGAPDRHLDRLFFTVSRVIPDDLIDPDDDVDDLMRRKTPGKPGGRRPDAASRPSAL